MTTASEGIYRKRGRPRKAPRTFSEQLRQRVRAHVGWCECCGRPVGNVAAAARAAKLPHASLHQFLVGRKPLSGPNIDRVLTWLDGEQEEAP